MRTPFNAPTRRPRALAATALSALSAVGLLTAASPSAAQDANHSASIRQGKPATGAPGDQYVYPPAVITNTGEGNLDTERLVINAGDNAYFNSDQLGVSRRDGQEEQVTCQRARRDTQLVCDVNLALKPQGWIAVYPEMGIDDNAPAPSASTVGFDLGSPAFAHGTSTIDVRQKH